MSVFTDQAPVAIVGVGCVLPDAHDVSSFWHNSRNGHSALRPLRGGRWDWEAAGEGGDAACKAPLGAQISDHSFDWRKFRIPPREARRINPMQLFILDAGAQALEGVAKIPRATTGLFIGATGLGWQPDSGLLIRLPDIRGAVAKSPAFSALDPRVRETILQRAEEALRGHLDEVSEDNVVNAAASVAIGRIAMHFDLRGLHYAVDAGFASSLAAVDVGVRALRDGSVDMAVVGGASSLLTPLEVLALSRLQRARQQTGSAAGQLVDTFFGEGAALFVLKRLEDAVADDETIWAVVRGVGAAAGGDEVSLSLAEPSGAAQEEALRCAYAAADVSPRSVGFVECASGWGTDGVVELRALATLYRGQEARRVALGSARALVGHLRGAAGAVGMLRAVLALHHGTIPPQRPFAGIDGAAFADTPFFLPQEELPFVPRHGCEVARAAVTALGFGGCSYHAILERFSPRMARSKAPSALGSRRREPIAIVGMGGVFPQGQSVAAFWQALLQRTDAAGHVPASRWCAETYYDADPGKNETTYTTRGYFVEPLPPLSPRWGISPAAAAAMDPSQCLVLQAAEEALADARFDTRRWDKRRIATMLAFLPYQGKKFLADIRVNVRVFIRRLAEALAAYGIDDATNARICREAEQRFVEPLPPIDEHTYVGYLGSINGARVAQRFGFGGPHFTVDAACASTHAALHAAVTALRHGVCDVALSGGVWLDMSPEFYVAACRFRALSPSGMTPFDAAADGFVPGEGGGVFVLRRLADAEAEGERIHAVIRAVAGASDGRGHSVLAPSVDGEALAMRRALQEADIAPNTVDYVECHGTGTALGDVTECRALTGAYGEGRSDPLLIGSVKGNVGHLNAAAGVPALVKTAIAVRDGMVPPSCHVTHPNPKIDFATCPLSVVTEVRPWPNRGNAPRRAGVSGFGVGGANMHLIVESHASPQPTTRRSHGTATEERTLPIAVVAGETLLACSQQLAALADTLSPGRQQTPFAYMEALRQTQIAASRAAPVRVALVAQQPERLGERQLLLQRVVAAGHDVAFLRHQGIFVSPGPGAAKVVAMFPGQGPQYPNMLRELADMFDVVEKILCEADSVYGRLTGQPLRPSFWPDDAADYVQRDEDIHCAVFVVNCCLFALLHSFGLRPDAVLGQSAGELAALVAAGVLSFADGLQAVYVRTQSVLQLQADDPGLMIAVGCGAAGARALLQDLPAYAAIAADNSPRACVVSLHTAARDSLLQRLQRAGVDAQVLPVSHGYHSKIIAAAQTPYRAFLRGLHHGPPRCEVVSSITGDFITRMPASDYPDHLARQYVEPAHFAPAVRALHDAGIRYFLECGPKGPLSTFVGDTLAGRPHVAQATLQPKVGEFESICRAIASGVVAGIVELPPKRAEDAPCVFQLGKPEKKKSVMASAASACEQQKNVFVQERSDADARAFLSALQRQIGEWLQRHPAVELGDLGAKTAPDLEQTSPEAPASPGERHVDPDASQTARASDARDELRRVLLAVVVRKTGYPETMLSDDMDLESDLGIDTVKQVSILAEVRETLAMPPDDNLRVGDLRTMAGIVAYLAERCVAVSGETPQALAASSVLSGAADVLSPSQVEQMIFAALAHHTGYPPDMLERDLDLEADLGIDTVKQARILADLRQTFGLSPDADFKIRAYNTIDKWITYLCTHRTGMSLSPPAVPEIAAGSVEACGDTSQLAPPKEARPQERKEGNSGAGADVLAARHDVEEAHPVAGALFTKAHLVTSTLGSLRGVAESACLTLLLEEASRDDDLEHPNVISDLSLHIPSIEQNGQSIDVRVVRKNHGEEKVFLSLEGDKDLRVGACCEKRLIQGVDVPQGVCSSLAVPIEPNNAEMLLQTVGRCEAVSKRNEGLLWAHSTAFDTVVGTVRLPSEKGPSAALAVLIESAGLFAVFGWYKLTGIVRWVEGMRRITIYRPPINGEKIWMHVQLVSPITDTSVANAWVLDNALNPLARCENVATSIVPNASIVAQLGHDGKSGLSWQRFCRLLQRPLLEGEDYHW